MPLEVPKVQVSHSADVVSALGGLHGLPAPEPAMGVEAYENERRLALDSDPRRKANYQAYLDSGRNADIGYLPIKLDFENVSRCNFRCTMCTVSDWEKGKRGEDMPLDDFKRIIDEQHGLLEMKLQGIGEPLMQGDPVFEMIRYARGKNIWVRTATNGSLLHLKDNYRKLIDSGVNEVQISVDGASKDVFESIRRGSVFERVVKNCKLINGYCREQGLQRTKMWTVMQKANRHQMNDLVRLGADVGFDQMVFSITLTDWGSKKWQKANDDSGVERAELLEAATGAIALGAELGIKVRFWDMAEKYSQATKGTLCPWPFERAFVSSDLKVVPCCMIGNPDACNLGQLGHFSDVWNSEAYRTFRQAHISGDLPDICVGCYER